MIIKSKNYYENHARKILANNIDSKETRKEHNQEVRVKKVTRDTNVANGVCPKCGGKMEESKPEPFEITNITNYKSFEEMANSALNVIAVCMEDWCIPCQILHPVINQIRKEYPDVFHFVEFDITYAERNDLIKKYKINGFPFFMLFKETKLVKVLSCPDTKIELVKKLNKYYKLT